MGLELGYSHSICLNKTRLVRQATPSQNSVKSGSTSNTTTGSKASRALGRPEINLRARTGGYGRIVTPKSVNTTVGMWAQCGMQFGIFWVIIHSYVPRAKRSTFAQHHEAKMPETPLVDLHQRCNEGFIVYCVTL